MDGLFWARLAVQAVVGGGLSAVVGLVVGYLFRRMVRNLFGGLLVQLGVLDPRAAAAVLAAAPTVPPSNRGGSMKGKPNKAIAAGTGVGLILLLEYVATSTELASVIEGLVGPQLAPLVPVVAGGLVLVAAVWKARYAPDVVAGRSTLNPPAPPAIDAGATLAAGLDSAGTAPTSPAVAAPPPEDRTSSTTADDAAPVSLDPRVEQALQQLTRVDNHTSVVQLAPVPVADYR